MNKIRVILADDHRLVRQGLRSLLDAQPDIEVVGDVSDGLELIALAVELAPDVVITDIVMPNLGGLEALSHLRQKCPRAQVLFLSMYSSAAYVIRALRGGAMGYLLKDDNFDVVLLAVRSIARRERFLSDKVLGEDVLAYLSDGLPAAAEDGHLTQREHEILCLVAQGLTSAQIARKLVISVRTVETHRSNIQAKLGLHGQAELTRFAIQQGILPLNGTIP